MAATAAASGFLPQVLLALIVEEMEGVAALQEHLCDYASAEVQTSGASLIVAELAKLPEDASKSELLSRLAAIEQGQRDLSF